MFRLCYITLGCAKNEVDSNRMRALTRAAGYLETDDPTLADAVIVNTCAFVTEASEEAIEVILQVAATEGVQQGKTKLIVAGCLPARYGSAKQSELARSLPEVDVFIAAADEDSIVSVLAELTLEPSSSFVGQGASGLVQSSLRIADEPWAYVKIADGCSRHCSFCTIPNIRGPYHSRPAAEIFAETDDLVSQGVREIVLIAQDTGVWCGNGETKGLSDLLAVLAERHPQVWLRVMYLQPQGVTEKLLATMARYENICNYLDIPLQHADATILKQMNRSGSGEHYLELLIQIRKTLPGVSLRTTMIAGFPGETKSQARASEHFIEAAGFTYAGVFAYSQEEGTLAGERTDQVPLRTRRARAQRLRDLADAGGFAASKELVGSVLDVLVCGFDEEGAYGRTQGMAPEVDGVVHLLPPQNRLGAQIVANEKSELSISLGDFVRVKITESVLYDLYGEVL